MAIRRQQQLRGAKTVIEKVDLLDGELAMAKDTNDIYIQNNNVELAATKRIRLLTDIDKSSIDAALADSGGIVVNSNAPEINPNKMWVNPNDNKGRFVKNEKWTLLEAGGLIFTTASDLTTIPTDSTKILIQKQVSGADTYYIPYICFQNTAAWVHLNAVWS